MLKKNVRKLFNIQAFESKFRNIYFLMRKNRNHFSYAEVGSLFELVNKYAKMINEHYSQISRFFCRF